MAPPAAASLLVNSDPRTSTVPIQYIPPPGFPVLHPEMLELANVSAAAAVAVYKPPPNPVAVQSVIRLPPVTARVVVVVMAPPSPSATQFSTTEPTTEVGAAEYSPPPDPLAEFPLSTLWDTTMEADEARMEMAPPDPPDVVHDEKVEWASVTSPTSVPSTVSPGLPSSLVSEVKTE